MLKILELNGWSPIETCPNEGVFALGYIKEDGAWVETFDKSKATHWIGRPQYRYVAEDLTGFKFADLKEEYYRQMRAKYPTQKEMAEAMGISQSTLSDQLKNMDSMITPKKRKVEKIHE